MCLDEEGASTLHRLEVQGFLSTFSVSSIRDLGGPSSPEVRVLWGDISGYLWPHKARAFSPHASLISGAHHQLGHPSSQVLIIK